MRLAIEQHTSLLKRDAEVRVKVWMTKLSEQVQLTSLALPLHMAMIQMHPLATAWQHNADCLPQ